MPPLRIAILECDTPVEKVNNKYGGYRGVFSLLLRESAAALGQPDKLDPETGLEISGWDVVTAQEYPNLEDVDAVVLSGSSKLLYLSTFPPYPSFPYSRASCIMHSLCKTLPVTHMSPRT